MKRYWDASALVDALHDSRIESLSTHANQHEIHRELGMTPQTAYQQALADKRSVIHPAPQCPWCPRVWIQQTRVRVGDDDTVPVGDQRQAVDAPPRTKVIRCLRPDGDIYYLRHAPDHNAKPIVLPHVPVF